MEARVLDSSRPHAVVRQTCDSRQPGSLTSRDAHPRKTGSSLLGAQKHGNAQTSRGSTRPCGAWRGGAQARDTGRLGLNPATATRSWRGTAAGAPCGRRYSLVPSARRREATCAVERKTRSLFDFSGHEKLISLPTAHLVGHIIMRDWPTRQGAIRELNMQVNEQKLESKLGSVGR